ncbi:hypothetical protein [Streptomyces griseorubiginosus]
MADPQYQALDTVTTVDDPKCKGTFCSGSPRPPAIRGRAARRRADTDEILTELGLTKAPSWRLARPEGAL